MIGFTKSIAIAATAMALTASLAPAQAASASLKAHRPGMVGCDLANWEPQLVARLKLAPIPCGGRHYPAPVGPFHRIETLGALPGQPATVGAKLRIASCGWACRAERSLSRYRVRTGPPAVAAVRG